MARIHIEENDDELPELAHVLRVKTSTTKSARSPQKKVPAPSSKAENASAKDENTTAKRKQRPLRKLDASQSLFGPFDAAAAIEPSKLRAKRNEARPNPRKGKPVKQIKIFEDQESEKGNDDEDGSFTSDEGSYHLSGDADSDDESWLGPAKDRESPFKKLLKSRPKSKLEVNDPALTLSPTKVTEPPNPFLGPRVAPPLSAAPTTTKSSRPNSSSSALDYAAILHYTPPKRISPSKKTSSTPPPPKLPPSPSKRLNSPSKSRLASIPRATICESLDAFWAQDVVNDWNEQYSPRKIVASPRKDRFAMAMTSEDENGGDPPSPSTSPHKSHSPQKGSPSRVKTKAAREMKKTWDVRKKTLAQEFLDELDHTITAGKLAELASATGGVQILWNKKLNTTAGRANWRREKVRDAAQPDGSTTTWFKHTANIELAEKVIDDEVRLVNVVAHEFCHLCNFMINGIRDNPHGKEFKEWYVYLSNSHTHTHLRTNKRLTKDY